MGKAGRSINILNMKISIITVCKNEKNTVSQTIQSVLAQDYPNIEYIIIDGLSSDGTWDIINTFGTRINKAIQEEDENLYEAMNKGLAASSGAVLYFLNANDFLDNPSSISCVMAIFNANPEIGIVQAKTRLTKTSESHRCYIPYQKPFKSTQDFLVNLPAHQGIFARRRVFEKTGFFNTRFDLFADYDWFLRAWKKKVPIYFFDQYIAQCTPFGISFTKRWIKLPQKLRVLWQNTTPSEFMCYFSFAVNRSFRKVIRLFFPHAHRPS